MNSLTTANIRTIISAFHAALATNAIAAPKARSANENNEAVLIFVDHIAEVVKLGRTRYVSVLFQPSASARDIVALSQL